MPLIDLEEPDVRLLPAVGEPDQRTAVACCHCERLTLNVGAVCARCIGAADLEERASAMTERLGLVVAL